ncbi:cation transporter [Herbiconiux sp. L3-i23]|uniref:cation transporter n=1 Tax=Herbiconiux sp. L3-i23 TaxID=2905871 RepID=UPI00207405A7|nr:cation transporter [Herbiconiux sp. L3-i23]
MVAPPLSTERTRVLRRRIKVVVAVTIVYNLVEAVVAVSAGAAASSVALIGFGLDSTVEVLSAAAVAWQFTRTDPERYEKPTLRVIAVAFFALAAYVTGSSVAALVSGEQADHSATGIVLTAVSVALMPFLSLIERRAGRELGSATAVADSTQTLLCALLSAAVLIGLVLNVLFGWWWADSIAALVVVVFAIREGVEAWRGDACATSVGMLAEENAR